MKILAINWHSGGNAALLSGGGRRARAILQGLAGRGHRIELLDIAPSIVPGDARIRTHEVPAWVRPNPRNALLPERIASAAYGSVRLALAARMLARETRPDVIYIPSAELLPCLWAGLSVQRLLHAPLAACATTIVSWGLSPRYRLLQRLTRRLLSRATLAIVLAPSVQRALLDVGFPSPIGIGLTGVDRAPLPAYGTDDKRLLFLGRLVAPKGVADAIWSFAEVHRHFPEVTLEIRGDGSRRERDKVRRIVRRTEISQSLTLERPVPTDDEKWTLLSRTWALLAPSYMEHFGLVVRESLSAGLPAVVYDLPPFEDIRNNPGLFCVPVGDTQALAAAMKYLVSVSSTDRRHLAEAARSSSIGPTWDEAVLREEELLTSIVSGVR